MKSISKKDIKRKLLETKEKKDILLIEQKIVESRIMMIFETQENIDNFSSLSKSKKEKIVKKLYEEFQLLAQQDMLNEQLGDFLGKIFGQGFGSIIQTLVEPMVNSILAGLGMQNSFFSKFLSSFIITRPSELIRAFKDCRAMTELVTKAIIEAMVMTVQQEKGLQGAGYTVIRNALGGAINDTKFAKDLSDRLEDFVCEIYHKLTGKAEKVYDKLKGDVSNVVTGGPKTQPAI